MIRSITNLFSTYRIYLDILTQLKEALWYNIYFSIFRSLKILVHFKFVVFSSRANFSPGLPIIWFTKLNIFSTSTLLNNFSISSPKSHDLMEK